MKYLALLLVTMVAASYAADQIQLNDEQRDRVRQVAKACIAQENTTKEAVQELRSGNFANAGQTEKCFVNCFLNKLGFLENGVPQENVLREKLGAIVGQEQVNAIMQQCNGLRGTENCDTAFKLYECYYKNKAGILA